METVSVSIEEELEEEVSHHAAENHDGNRSEAVRELLRRGLEYPALARKVDRLEEQQRALLEQREEHTELVKYVEHERQRDRERDEAPVWERARWWLLGRDRDD
jgi:metal-responsive CopG/Arc/MetJ family transcriptional regulator